MRNGTLRCCGSAALWIAASSTPTPVSVASGSAALNSAALRLRSRHPTVSGDTRVRISGVVAEPLCCGGPILLTLCSKVSASGDDVNAMLDPTALPSDVGHLSDDVLREREAAYTTVPSADVPILVRDLRKEFPPMDGNPMKVAVKTMSLKVSKGECFGCAAQMRCGCGYHRAYVPACMLGMCQRPLALGSVEQPASGFRCHGNLAVAVPPWLSEHAFQSDAVCRLLGPNGAGKSTSINMVRCKPQRDLSTS